MTDRVVPSLGGESDPLPVAQTIKYAGANDPGWIAGTNTDVLAGHEGLSGAPLNAFDHAATSGFDVTIDTGEGFVEGAWVARDTQTTVTLASSTTGQTVYLGWDVSAEDTAIIGLDAAFAAEDPRMAIWTFDTDGSTVTSTTDEREIGFAIRQPLDAPDGTTIGLLGLLGSDATYAGSLGDSQAEVFRAPGGSSDAVFAVEDGSGALTLAYNAYFDGSWRFTAGSTRAYLLQFSTDEIRLRVSASATGAAGDAITWNDVTVTSSADLVANSGLTMYDAATDTVPQGRLGGPSSSLTSYPLPPGDLETGSGSGLDADTVDGFEASELQGGEWASITSFSDTDDTTGLNFDTGTLATVYDLYKIHAVYVNHGSIDAGIQCRVQNDSTSNYNMTKANPPDQVDEILDRDSWENLGKSEPNQLGHFEALIRGGNVAGLVAGNDAYPTISHTGAGTTEDNFLMRGTMTVDYPTVDQLTFFTEMNATGKVTVLGKTL